MDLISISNTTVTLSFVEEGTPFYIEIMGREVSVYDYWTYFDESDNCIQPTLHTNFRLLHFHAENDGYIELYYKLRGKERLTVVSKEREEVVFEGDPDDYYGIPF